MLLKNVCNLSIFNIIAITFCCLFSLSRRRHSSFGEYKLLSFLLSVLPSASLLHAGAIEDVWLSAVINLLRLLALGCWITVVVLPYFPETNWRSIAYAFLFCVYLVVHREKFVRQLSFRLIKPSRV